MNAAYKSLWYIVGDPNSQFQMEKIYFTLFNPQTWNSLTNDVNQNNQIQRWPSYLLVDLVRAFFFAASTFPLALGVARGNKGAPLVKVIY